MPEMPERIPLLIERVERLENFDNEGIRRIEHLIRQEISDLKAEQLADIKTQIERLGDDQRRLWDAVRILEQSMHVNQGSSAVYNRFINIMSALVSGTLVAIASYFIKKS